MTNRFVRAIAAGTMLTVGSGSVGCGYFLHPERRGTQSGVIDGATMVMDILWLIPGIIPGVIALVVDFSSGAIYISGSRRVGLHLSPDGRVALQVPHAARPGQVEFRLVTASHQVLARKTALVGPGHRQGRSPSSCRSARRSRSRSTSRSRRRTARPRGERRGSRPRLNGAPAL